MSDSSIPTERDRSRLLGTECTSRSPASDQCPESSITSLWARWSSMMIWIARSFIRRFESLNELHETTTDNSDYDLQSITTIAGEQGFSSPINENITRDAIPNVIVGERTTIQHITQNIRDSMIEDYVMPESRTIGDEERPSTRFQSPSNQNESSPANSNSSFLTAPSTVWTYFVSNPKAVVYLLTTYLVLLGFIFYGHTKEKDIPSTANHLIILSVSAFAMAILVICTLSWIHEHLQNLNPSYQDLYMRCYKILLIAYYILCILAYSSLLSALLILQLQQDHSNLVPPAPGPHPHPPPPPRPHPHRVS